MPRVPRPLESLSPAYRQRIERGLARGMTRAEARGHRPTVSPITGEIETESQRRRRLIRERQAPIGGSFLSPEQIRALDISQRYGLSLDRYDAIASTLDEINEMSSPNSQIYPEDVKQVVQWSNAGILEPDALETLLEHKYAAMVNYRNQGHKPGPQNIGYSYWQERNNVLPIVWYFYH